MEFNKPLNFISFSPPWMDKEEEQSVLDTLRNQWITTGPKVKEFEKGIAEYVNNKFSIATFSCTDAMHIALKTLDINEGDEVITTPYTFASTAHVICYHRAKPVFVDVENDTFNIDPAKIEARITKKTKAIIPVHYGGHACDMDSIMEIARKHKLYVMEDAAHAIGTEYKGKKIGSIGDITCFSFYATKNLTTAEGGAAVTKDEGRANRMRILTMYGISDAREIWQNRYSQQGSIHYDIVELGYKCNMTDICAGIGIQQLKKLDYFNGIRKNFAEIYDDAFRDHPGLKIPTIKAYTKSSRHLYPLLVNLDYLSINRDQFIYALKENNIGTAVLFKPLHLHFYYADLLKHVPGDFPIAEKLFASVVCLPISPKLGEASIKKVAEVVLHLIKKYKR